jgi:hypothetical protein
MLATPLILFESPFGRMHGMGFPGLAIRGPQELHLILAAILWSMALVLVFGAAIWLRYRDKASPFLVAGGFIVAQMLGMGLLSQSDVLKPVLVVIGQAPSAALVLTGLAIGAATRWAGWQAGKRPAASRQGAVQAA